MNIKKLAELFHALGPGILLAATAIGVSHLVQAVQAGAKYGYLFILAIIVAHFIKFPFFEAAPRYSSVTKRSLLHGYYLLNPIYLVIYLLITIFSMFALLAAVTVVAAGIFANLLPFSLDIKLWSTIVLLCCFTILITGKYDFLDNAVKYIIFALALISLIALILAFFNHPVKLPDYQNPFNLFERPHILFLIAFLGWMPCPLDCSVWNSIWIVEKNQHHKQDVSYKKSLLDFRVGFFTTAFLAIIFLMLGNLMFYGTNTELPVKSIDFVAKFLSVYVSNLGDWSFYLIAGAAFIAMFSTVITCLDAYPRVLTKGIKLLFYQPQKKILNEDKTYSIILTLTLFGTIATIYFLITNMKQLVLVATTISFLVTPVIAWFNLKLLVSDNYPKKYHPKASYLKFCYSLIIILILFCLWFLYNTLLQ